MFCHVQRFCDLCKQSLGDMKAEKRLFHVDLCLKYQQSVCALNVGNIPADSVNFLPRREEVA